MDRVGFIGLGTMGAAMAANIVRAGFPLTVWNRTSGRGQELVDLGASFGETPAAVAADSDIVVICVSDTPDVEAILFGADGVTAGAREGTLVIEIEDPSVEVSLIGQDLTITGAGTKAVSYTHLTLPTNSRV